MSSIHNGGPLRTGVAVHHIPSITSVSCLSLHTGVAVHHITSITSVSGLSYTGVSSCPSSVFKALPVASGSCLFCNMSSSSSATGYPSAFRIL